MKKYTFLVYHNDYNKFLSLIQSMGVVHISLKNINEEDDQFLQQHLQKKAQIIHLLNQGAPDNLIQEKNEIEQNINTLYKKIEQLRLWGNVEPKKITALQQVGYNLKFYECPKKLFNESWGVKLSDQKNNTFFITINEGELPNYCIEHIIGQSSLNELEQQYQTACTRLKSIKEEIETWKKNNTPYLQNELRQIDKNIEWQNIKLSTDNLADGSIALIEGYCPANETDKLNQCLDNKTDIAQYYKCTDPQENDDPPIKLKNNRFIKMFECLTGMYGLPKYTEFDPTPVLGPFFLLFFSLCIGDAGYGLLLILIGFLIHKEKLNIAMFKGLGPIIMALGGGSVIIGFLMGTFFGIDIFNATWLPQQYKVMMFRNLGENGKIGEYDVMMVLALIIGIVHICLAITIKAISFTRNKGIKETISTWSWLILIIGTIVIGSLMMTHHLSQTALQLSVILIGAVSVLGIFIFNHPGRNPLINIGAGLWDTYGTVTGLLGDILSYIRLYALGLAGGMLGMAFNQLGSMVLGNNPNVGTIIGFVLIVTFGHVLNLLMACLGAFVHPLRLTFVEYFKNAGYQGTGKKYKPFEL